MYLHEILGIKESQITSSHQILNESQSLQKKTTKIPLGSRNFDDVIGGGFSQGKKYLVFGPNKTGKTQLCHQLCVQAYNYFNNITDKKCIKNIFYFDTENTFRPERLKELLLPSVSEIDNLLKTILVSKIMSNSALLLALKDFDNIIKNLSGGVLIIDSINNHFRSDLGNKDLSFNKTKNKFLKILHKINELTHKHNLMTVVTSQVTSNFARKGNIRVLPVGNQFLNHFFSEYVYLSKNDKDTNFVQLVNSLALSEKKLLYKITSKGIRDLKL
ncbi:MAG: AAA family ATPase [Candidatus Lokiarchaeota archaeon]|nr:AAA family ATPase [Candidatus Lokiarchaeota archaeon]